MFHLVSTVNMRALRVYDSPNTWFLHASITSIRLEYQRLTFLTLVCHCFGPFFGQAKANFNDKNKIKSYKKSEKSTELSYIFNYIYQNIHVYAFVWLEKWERGMVPDEWRSDTYWSKWFVGVFGSPVAWYCVVFWSLTLRLTKEPLQVPSHCALWLTLAWGPPFWSNSSHTFITQLHEFIILLGHFDVACKMWISLQGFLGNSLFVALTDWSQLLWS